MSCDEYEYDYSGDEDEEDYPVEDSGDEMEWSTQKDNPNAAPVLMGAKGMF